MAHTVSIKEGRKTIIKSRIFERGSRKHPCMICGERKFGVLIRHIAPVKKETLICDECIILMSLGKEIVVGKKVFGLYSKAKAKKKATKKKTAKKPAAKNIKKPADKPIKEPNGKADKSIGPEETG